MNIFSVVYRCDFKKLRKYLQKMFSFYETHFDNISALVKGHFPREDSSCFNWTLGNQKWTKQIIIYEYHHSHSKEPISNRSGWNSGWLYRIGIGEIMHYYWLEQRQNKNDTIWSMSKLILKLPLFFTARIGEWKSAANIMYICWSVMCRFSRRVQ